MYRVFRGQLSAVSSSALSGALPDNYLRSYRRNICRRRFQPRVYTPQAAEKFSAPTRWSRQPARMSQSGRLRLPRDNLKVVR